MSHIRLALLSLIPVIWGCSTLQEGPPPEPLRNPLDLALVEMERERFRAAELHLREAASACPGTDSAVEALLLLSVLHLDPRFPGRDPETAARYAARVIWRDHVPATQLEVARGLYLAALELGAPSLSDDAEGDGPGVSPRAAGIERASNGQSWAPLAALPVPRCPGVDGVRRTAEALPRHPGPVLARSIGLARAALDSIEAAAPEQEVEGQVQETSEEERLRARVEQLEAELSRIRRLLRGGH